MTGSRLDRWRWNRITGGVIFIGLLIVVPSAVEERVAGIVGGLVLLLAVVPVRLAARAEPVGIGREQLRPELRTLGWFVLALATCGVGMLIASR